MCHELFSVIEPLVFASAQQTKDRRHADWLILKFAQCIIGATSLVEKVAFLEQFAGRIR